MGDGWYSGALVGSGWRDPGGGGPPMPGPAPTYRPTLTPEEVAVCERLLRCPTAPQAQVARAKLALLLHARPDLDTAALARQLGRHVNWVFRWRRTWAQEGFR